MVEIKQLVGCDGGTLIERVDSTAAILGLRLERTVYTLLFE
jgi:hypothetical protein